MQTALPYWSIGLSVFISLVFALINIGSTVAFNAFTSLLVAGIYSTFLVSISVMLYQRLRFYSKIQWGPFKLGRFGVPINVVSLFYSIVGVVFSFFPPSAKPNAQSMNWSVTVYGGVLIFSLLFWVAHGRRVYTGPLHETRLL